MKRYKKNYYINMFVFVPAAAKSNFSVTLCYSFHIFWTWLVWVVLIIEQKPFKNVPYKKVFTKLETAFQNKKNEEIELF